MIRRYAFDTVVLSNFALAGALDIVRDRYRGAGVVLAEVGDELAGGVARGFTALQAVDDLIEDRTFSFVSLDPPERVRYRELRRSLGSGEAACIAWSETRGATVVTDDRRAREACRSAGVPFTGTIGILIASCRDGTLGASRGEEVLRRMKAAGFYSPVSRLGDLL